MTDTATATATQARTRVERRRMPRYPGTPVLGPADRHLLRRFTYGINQDLVADVKRLGGGQAWFEDQVATAYDDTPADGSDDALCDWFPDLHRDPRSLWQRTTSEVRGVWEVMDDYGRRAMLRRMYSRHQLLEVMSEFFENHLHVTVSGDKQAYWRASYGPLVRRHALGRFDLMLVGAITHPAMLLYLDGSSSTKDHPNENLGRELLELHTVGRGAYSEDDVKASARILTGWSVDEWRTWAFSYRSQDHWTGQVDVMGFSDANAAPDGRDLTRRYLTYLAHHPLTAQRICRKLATHFVCDDPSQALVDRLAKAYLDNDTAIVPVLRALVTSPEFRAAGLVKLRDPVADVVATHRALGTRITPPTSEDSAANDFLWQATMIGMNPGSWPRPDGPPLDSTTWATPGRALNSMTVHTTLAGGWWPDQGITYRRPVDWLPRRSITFGELVDHMSRLVLGQPADRTLLRAAGTAAQCRPGTVITADHALVKWGFPRYLSVFLDHPVHYKR